LIVIESVTTTTILQASEQSEFPIGISFLNSSQYVGISRKRANHHVWLKTLEQCGEVILEPRKTGELYIEILLAIEPAINRSPCARCEIDDRQIAFSDELVHRPIGFGKQIVQFYLCPFGGHAAKSIANSTRSAVVTFPEARCEDQYSFFHSLSGHRNARWESRLTR